MTNFTISLSDETLRMLRKYVRERYNSKKGALSGVIEESLRETLEAFSSGASLRSETFRAVKNEQMMVEASSLAELAAKLKKNKIDPRSVRILSSKTLAPAARAGLRGRIT